MTEASTRDRLIETAAELFHEHGYGATAVADILRRANVRSGSFYHFFPSKEALLLAVLQRYTEWLYPMVLEPAFARTADPIERVFAVLYGYREMLLMTQFTRGCPIGNLALEMSDKHPQVRELVLRNFRGWCDAIRDCLIQAGDRLPAILDREAMAQFVLTVMEGGIMQARAQRGIEPYDTSVKMLRDYFDCLLAEQADENPRRKGA